MTAADLNKQPRQVAAMFDGVARRYDLTNDVISLGQTRSWRRATVRALDPMRGERILDVAAGTGSSTAPLAAAGAGAIACDFSTGMMAVGRRQFPAVTFVGGDATKLPFRDGAFDAVLISFGLRNVADAGAALREFARVTVPGGRLVVCEFSAPTSPIFRRIYLEYLMVALPRVAQAVAANPVAYTYLAESIRAWPNQRELAQLIAASGWRGVQWQNLSAGIVALHRAWKA